MFKFESQKTAPYVVQAGFYDIKLFCNEIVASCYYEMYNLNLMGNEQRCTSVGEGLQQRSIPIAQSDDISVPNRERRSRRLFESNKSIVTLRYVVIQGMRGDGSFEHFPPLEQEVANALYPVGRPEVGIPTAAIRLNMPEDTVKSVNRGIFSGMAISYIHKLRDELAAVADPLQQQAILKRLYVEAISGMTLDKLHQDHYIDQQLSFQSLEDIFRVPHAMLHRCFILAGLRIRSRSEAHQRRQNRLTTHEQLSEAKSADTKMSRNVAQINPRDSYTTLASPHDRYAYESETFEESVQAQIYLIELQRCYPEVIKDVKEALSLSDKQTGILYEAIAEELVAQLKDHTFTPQTQDELQKWTSDCFIGIIRGMIL